MNIITYLGENKRTIVKSVGWEFSMFLLITGITFSWFGLSWNSFLYSVFVTIIKSVLLISYLKWWKKIKWGKKD